MEKERVTPLTISEIAQKRRIFTELKKTESAKTYNSFQITTETNPIYTAGGESTTIFGTFQFAEVVAGYIGEEERVKVRLDGWHSEQAELLFGKVSQFGTVEDQKVIFDHRLSLSELAEAVGSVESDGISESAKQLRMYDQDRKLVHFGPNSQKPKYLLTQNNELAAYDDKLESYIRLKHTTSDPAVISSIEQIEKYCQGNPGRPVKAVLIGALSARTRGSLPTGANHIVVTRFSKNEAGEIDFESDLPPDNQTLAQELKRLGVEESIRCQVLSGVVENAVLKTEKPRAKENESKREKVVWRNSYGFAAGAVYTPVTSPHSVGGQRASYGFGGAGFSSAGILLNEEEEEVWQIAYNLWLVVIKLTKSRSQVTEEFAEQKVANLTKISTGRNVVIGKTKNLVDNFYSKIAKLTTRKENIVKETANTVSLSEIRERKEKVKVARPNFTPQPLAAAA